MYSLLVLHVAGQEVIRFASEITMHQLADWRVAGAVWKQGKDGCCDVGRREEEPWTLWRDIS